MANLTPELFYRRNLPHVQPPGGTFFVTFRLAGSIPVHVLAELHAQAVQAQEELKRTPDSPERTDRLYLETRRFFGRWDAALADSAGPDWLHNPQVAALVVNSMRYFDGQRYDLLAYCVMPNHVHVVLTPLRQTETDDYSLARIMHSMKGYSAGQANRILGRTGAFWHHENYDHYARSSAELERIIHYVLDNPVKAGLVEDWRDWPWSYYKHNPEDCGTIAGAIL